MSGQKVEEQEEEKEEEEESEGECFAILVTAKQDQKDATAVGNSLPISTPS